MSGKSKFLIPLIVTVLCLQSCGGSIDVGNFDQQAWKTDIKGCSQDRQGMVNQIDDLKLKLLGLHHKKIVKVLGSPEEQELSKRSQNYYSYFIDPAPSCETSAENPRKLVIRFTALGIANEVSIR